MDEEERGKGSGGGGWGHSRAVFSIMSFVYVQITSQFIPSEVVLKVARTGKWSFLGSVLPGTGLLLGSVLPGSGLILGNVLPGSGFLLGSVLPGSGLLLGSVLPGSGLILGNVLPGSGLILGNVLPGSGFLLGSVLPGGGLLPGSVAFFWEVWFSSRQVSSPGKIGLLADNAVYFPTVQSTSGQCSLLPTFHVTQTKSHAALLG